MNAGITPLEMVIIFDFNEFTSDFEIARREITAKKWINQHTFKYQFLLKPELKKKLLLIMEQELTEKVLIEAWNQKSL